MHLHILGICGTFMAGIAALAREAGHKVTGSDGAAYPPMSTQLEQLGITVMKGYEPAHLQPAPDVAPPDVVLVGNVISRGNPALEYVLDKGLRYVSGPQWLAENILRGRHVLAVAGTHGKTSTASLLAWLLEYAGLAPGFLIGGVPQNFGVSARLGGGKYFVVEADEYDTAFDDKRSKFVHYHPRTLILNNLEYDHADIFPDLASIERQFHHLLRTVPRSGRVIANGADEALARVLKMGCWSELEYFDAPGVWQAGVNGDQLEILRNGKLLARGRTPLAGAHNHSNTLAAIAAAAHIGVPVEAAVKGLAEFRNVKRRLELVAEAGGVKVYDDFAHHPTAIKVTIAALRLQGPGRILAVLEPRSNTMRMGVSKVELARSLGDADQVYIYARPDLKWDAAGSLSELGGKLRVAGELDELVAAIAGAVQANDRVLLMSNGDFGGIHSKLVKALSAGAAA